MKNLIKITFLLLALLGTGTASAYDFEVDGIYYKFAGYGVSVTYKSYTYSSNTATYYSDYTGEVTIPVTVTYNGNTYPVTEIDNNAFNGCRTLTGISIPSSVYHIGWDAFEYCSKLTRINIEDIAAWCNLTCGSEFYPHYLYLNGTEVTDLTIPEGITAIRNNAFGQCLGLTSVTIGNSVKTIGSNAFEDCTDLTSVTLGDSITEIGDVAFEGCTSLTSVTFGNSVTMIKDFAFEGCTSLTSIEIPNSVTYIGVNAFKNCTGLTGVTLGAAVTNIGGGAFQGCEGLTSVEIPNSVTFIGAIAFKGCTELTHVTIGNSVAEIGQDAFMNAPAIETVTCKAKTPPSWYDTSMFTTNVYNHAPLHVPTGCERAYMAHEGWGQFLTIIGDVVEENPAGDVNGDGEVTVADANSVTEVITNGGSSGHSRLPYADVNGDGEINIADFNAIIDLILSH